MPVQDHYAPSLEILSLGEGFYDEVRPATFPMHTLRFRNRRWDKRIGLGALTDDEWRAHMARFEPLPRNLAKPLALRYHGHQFDSYNPHLGDGRGFLYAQLRDTDGRLLDLGTKGSGTTPWSRGGDGRLTLKGGIREVLATEMLEALGVYTSKSLSLFETGEKLVRGDEPSPTRSSVLVRLSHSHLRIGTFQRLANLRQTAELERLVTYSIKHYFPDLEDLPSVDKPAALFLRVANNAAILAASYMAAGFVHGVLNSDNMTITGESFDYGPYRFLPRYDALFTAAYFDESGLYAFGRQPRAILKNVLRLGEALRLLTPDLAFGPAAAEYEARLESELCRRVVARLGLASQGDVDIDLMSAVFAFLGASGISYGQFFFDLHGGLGRQAGTHYKGTQWEQLREIIAIYTRKQEPTARLTGYLEGPGVCDLLIDEIEAIWQSIAAHEDFGPFEEKVRLIREMGDALGLAEPPHTPP